MVKSTPALTDYFIWEVTNLEWASWKDHSQQAAFKIELKVQNEYVASREFGQQSHIQSVNLTTPTTTTEEENSQLQWTVFLFLLVYPLGLWSLALLLQQADVLIITEKVQKKSFLRADKIKKCKVCYVVRRFNSRSQRL